MQTHRTRSRDTRPRLRTRAPPGGAVWGTEDGKRGRDEGPVRPGSVSQSEKEKPVGKVNNGTAGPEPKLSGPGQGPRSRVRVHPRGVRRAGRQAPWVPRNTGQPHRGGRQDQLCQDLQSTRPARAPESSLTHARAHGQNTALQLPPPLLRRVRTDPVPGLTPPRPSPALPNPSGPLRTPSPSLTTAAPRLPGSLTWVSGDPRLSCPLPPASGRRAQRPGLASGALRTRSGAAGERLCPRVSRDPRKRRHLPLLRPRAGHKPSLGGRGLPWQAPRGRKPLLKKGLTRAMSRGPSRPPTIWSPLSR